MPQPQLHHQPAPKHSKFPKFRGAGINIGPESVSPDPTLTCDSLPQLGSGMLDRPPCWHPSMQCQGVCAFGHGNGGMESISPNSAGVSPSSALCGIRISVCGLPVHRTASRGNSVAGPAMRNPAHSPPCRKSPAGSGRYPFPCTKISVDRGGKVISIDCDRP